MGAFARFFCLGSTQNDENWSSSRSGYEAGYVNAAARSKVLGIVDEEVSRRFGTLSPASRAHDEVPVQHLLSAHLPATERGLCKELLRKLGAIDHARRAAQQENNDLLIALKEAEATARHAEFSREAAKAVATARGSSLRRCQLQLKETEAEQILLTEALRQALLQLGAEFTPGQPLLSPTNLLVGDSSQTPLPAMSLAFMQQLVEKQQAEQLRASIAASESQRSQQQGMQGHGPRAKEGVPHNGHHGARQSQALSGFTVYSNGLSPDNINGRSHDATDVQPQQRHEEEEEQQVERCQSGVLWKDISQAASGSLSASEDRSLQRRSVSSAVPLQQGRALQEEGGNIRHSQDHSQRSTGSRDRHTARIAQLVLPYLDAEHLDMVRVGASTQSSAVLQEILPPGVWQSGVQPEQLLLHLQRAAGFQSTQSLQGAVGSRHQALTLKLDEESRLQEDDEASNGLESPEVPGAGTWVSPTLSAQMHAKAKTAALFGAPEPSPPAHIKAVRQAVFSGDMEFYNALGAGLKGPSAPLRDSHSSMLASSAAPLPLVRDAQVDRASSTAGLQASVLSLPPAAGRVSVGSTGQHTSGSAGETLAPQRIGAWHGAKFQPMGGQVTQQAAGKPASLLLSRSQESRLRRSAEEFKSRPAGANQPITKRSLDSIDAAMVALAPQQHSKHLGASTGALSPARPPVQPQHTRGSSMPPVLSEADYWRQQEQQRFAQGRSSHYQL